MKNSLLSSVAVLALVFGGGQVLAQGMKGEAPAQKSESAAPSKSESAAPSKSESTAPSPKAESSSPVPKASTAETAPPSKSGATAQDKGEMKGSKAANEMKSDTKQPSTAQTTSPAAKDSKAGATTGNAATSATAAPPAEKRTQIVSAIKTQKVEEVTNVNFNISVGAVVPASVRFHALPPRIVEIYPEWRGYEFILVRGKYIIVRPQTHEIVYIIEG